MLKKLFKYEWKFFWKVPATINLALAIITLMGIMFLVSPLWKMESWLLTLLMSASLMIYYLSIFAGSIGVIVYIAIRFYRSSYTDEGYLTHTLPVTPRQIILSKLSVGVIWYAITNIVILFSVMVLLISFVLATGDFDSFYELRYMWGELFSLFQELTKMGFQSLNFCLCVLLLLLLFVAGAFFNMLMLFSSISLGQMFPRHKIAGAVGWYIAEYMIVQFVSTILTSLSALGLINAFDSASSPVSLINLLLAGFLILILACDAVMYFVTEYMMKKKLNLD